MSSDLLTRKKGFIMSNSSSVISSLQKKLTLCENLVKNYNYKDDIDFVVSNAINTLKNNIAYEGIFSLEMWLNMDLAAPKYAVSQNEDGSYTARKYFDISNQYKMLPPAEYYQAFKKAIVHNGIKSADYFASYEQSKLEALQNFFAEEGITSVNYEEGDFCTLFNMNDSRPVECIGEECIRADI
jgi:hypothetical protein